MAADNTSAQVPEAKDTRPFTLQEAADSLSHDAVVWENAATPSDAEWLTIRAQLADAESSASSLTGLQSMLRQHHYAKLMAEDGGAEYKGIDGYQAGCLAAAVDALAWSTARTLNEVREAVSIMRRR